MGHWLLVCPVAEMHSPHASSDGEGEGGGGEGARSASGAAGGGEGHLPVDCHTHGSSPPVLPFWLEPAPVEPPQVAALQAEAV